VTKDDSKLLIYVDPDHGNCVFVGNRKGYLRVGIEMLRAAIVLWPRMNPSRRSISSICVENEACG
jgi:hypothetical protein